jgi:glycerol-3-phosphate acyltransferase PlsY
MTGLDLTTVAAAVLGYLLGSIPFGLIFTHLAGTQDLRSIGSGNIGATNVLRTGRKDVAAATLLGDALKGTAAVLIARAFAGEAGALAAALAAVLGHVFPVWLNFKGGKGVATYIGVLAGLSWPVMAAFCAIWLVTAIVTRYASAASLLAGALTPGVAWFIGDPHLALLCLILSAVLWIMHRANIARLAQGTESKIGAKAAADR